MNPGIMAPDDPFFWFCSQNYALYTYPANNVPRNRIKDGAGLTYRYADMVSRTGTPEPRVGARVKEEVDDLYFQDEHKPVPPSINLCQPTETTHWKRQRWEVEKEFVDEKKCMLGDANWFPGAAQHRFTFEVTTNDVERYVRMGKVPQVQLLYVEHLWVPRVGPSKRATSPKPEPVGPGVARAPGEGNESSSSDNDSVAARQRAYRPKPVFKRRGQQRQKNAGAEQVVSVMLPPLSARG